MPGTSQQLSMLSSRKHSRELHKLRGMTSRSASALREPPEYREFVASRLDPSGLTRPRQAGIPAPGSAVVIGEDGPHRRRVAASLRQGPWRVKRAAGDEARAFAVVAVVASVALDE